MLNNVEQNYLSETYFSLAFKGITLFQAFWEGLWLNTKIFIVLMSLKTKVAAVSDFVQDWTSLARTNSSLEFRLQLEVASNGIEIHPS